MARSARSRRNGYLDRPKTARSGIRYARKGVALRDWCPELLAASDPSGLARRYCRTLAAHSGHDEDAIWEWGYLERVSTGLYCLAMGADGLGRPFLQTAAALL